MAVKSVCIEKFIIELKFFELHGGEYEDLEVHLTFYDTQSFHLPNFLDNGPYQIGIETPIGARKFIPQVFFSLEDFVEEDRKCYSIRDLESPLGFYIDAKSVDIRIEPELWRKYFKKETI